MEKSKKNYNPSLSRMNLEQQVRMRADKDIAFREELKASPRAILERDYADWFFDGKVPEGKKIIVTEEDEQTLHIVLSPDPSHRIGEKELEGVQGGFGGFGGLLKVKSGVMARLEGDGTTLNCVTKDCSDTKNCTNR